MQPFRGTRPAHCGRTSVSLDNVFQVGSVGGLERSERSDMEPTRSRLVGVAAALSTIAVAAPVSPAAAETAAPVRNAAARVGELTDVPFAPGAFALGATVVGPVIITAAPSFVVNANNQVSVDGNWFGPQVAP
jgi:hypothetical protein